MLSPLRLFLFEAITVGETAGLYYVRSEGPQVDRSTNVVVVVEEILVVLIVVVYDLGTPILLSVTVSLESLSLGAARLDVSEESLDSEVGLRSR
jgi:hypothetical protein